MRHRGRAAPRGAAHRHPADQDGSHTAGAHRLRQLATTAGGFAPPRTAATASQPDNEPLTFLRQAKTVPPRRSVDATARRAYSRALRRASIIQLQRRGRNGPARDESEGAGSGRTKQSRFPTTIARTNEKELTSFTTSTEAPSEARMIFINQSIPCDEIIKNTPIQNLLLFTLPISALFVHPVCTRIAIIKINV